MSNETMTETATNSALIAVVPSAVLATMIGQVACVAADGNDRAIWECVHVQVKRGVLMLAATDGYRVAIAKTRIQDRIHASAQFNVLLNAKALRQLAIALITNAELMVPTTHVRYAPDARQVAFDICGDGAIVVNIPITAGVTPRYELVIPKRHDARAIVPAEKLAKATAEMLADATRASVRITTTGERPGGYKTKRDWREDEYYHACFSTLAWVEDGVVLTSAVGYHESVMRRVRRTPHRMVVGADCVKAMIDAHFLADAAEALADAGNVTIDGLSDRQPITLSGVTAIAHHAIETTHCMATLSKSC